MATKVGELAKAAVDTTASTITKARRLDAASKMGNDSSKLVSEDKSIFSSK